MFAEIVGFNLVLADKKQQTVPADPRCYFLPFYVNQDGSWQAAWNTFAGLTQYSKPIGAILDYFTGVKPPEYYEVSSRRSQAQNALDGFRREAEFLKRARERIGKNIPLSGPKVHPENFEKEIEELTTEVTQLNRDQEKLREKSVRQQQLISNIELQVALARDALAAYDADAGYLRSQPREKLQCPTCGAEHAESFLDLMNFAEDARVLRELVARLQQDAVVAHGEHMKIAGELRELDSSYSRVAAILDTRRGEMQFGQVVDSLGAESALRAFEDEGAVLNKEIQDRLMEIEKLTKRLKELTNARRSKEILNHFRESYASALFSLNLPPIDTHTVRLTTRPDMSGSGGPRSILAYYSALWRTCFGRYGSFAVPLIVDAPNQQGQDNINLPKVLRYIAENLPDGAQVLLGTEIDIKEDFDKRIYMEAPYQLLQAEQYDAVSCYVDPLLSAMYAGIEQMGSVKED